MGYFRSLHREPIFFVGMGVVLHPDTMNMSVKSTHLLTAALLMSVLPGSIAAQVLSCGPGLGYDAANSDHILFVGATCMRTMTVGPATAGAHVAYGFGNYDASEFAGVDGSYSAFRINVILSYPIAVSPDSPIAPQVFVAPGILSWSEDCDYSDCSDTEFIVDVGGGASYNQFSAEIYAIAGGSLDFGARLRALFPLN